MKKGIALAFIGAGIEDTLAEGNASSRAGQMFQENMIKGIIAAGMRPYVISVKPTPSYPRSRRLWFSTETVTGNLGLPIRLLPFFNVTPIKQITIGVALVMELIRWRITTRQKAHHIIHTYNLTVPPGICTWLACKLTGAKFSASINDIPIPGQMIQNTWATRLDFKLQKFLIPRLDARFIVSDAIAADFLKHGQNFTLVEGGINELAISIYENEKPSPQAGVFRLIYAGTLDKANGIDLVLGAMKILAERNIELITAGDGPLIPTVQEAAKSDQRIRYLGLLPFSDILRLYLKSNLLLNVRITGKIDTRYFFPSKMMEYLASGVPVLTTATGHVQREFGSMVYILADESAEGLAAKIAEIMSESDSNRGAKGGSAQRYMMANKTWKAQSEKVVRIWKGLFEAGPFE